MLGGNTATGARRSTTTNAQTSRPPKASSPAAAIKLCGSSAALTASAAAPRISSDRTGIRIGSPGCSSRPAGSTTLTATAIATVSIASAENVHRHSPHRAKKPPTAGPHQGADPHIADTSADARVHSALGSTALISA
ncbi:hypothetical protein C1Y40_01252 [Mycobacterium talmoniae]|uniref:Uncharacterized protein n=1 Tax=Mycobacterium talmoniae TaxID=1858794 RepID=A0A2S8BPD7_9MYCO|nr:hypothetical protein C1Y40_01252 [Mycobacterium talmoniae]